METIRLTGRSSRLSILQIEIAEQIIAQQFPGIKVERVLRESRGDTLAQIPLQTVGGTDFFTGDFFDMLTNDEADIAIHSLKDMSSAHFFGPNQFAVIDRDDPRDIAIFNPDIITRLQEGKTIVIGTCSPRREEMASEFLQTALPQGNQPIQIETRPIRGNVETRLQQLSNGEYDATILATAGLNRLLRSEKDKQLIRQLLADKKLMLLPLFECVPAPCQGAIVAEALPENQKAVAILQAINDSLLYKTCAAEKKEALRHGAGCEQKFGVTTIRNHSCSGWYAAGRDNSERLFEYWENLPAANQMEYPFFSGTDFMKEFFDYAFSDEVPELSSPVVFVANYKGIQDPFITEQLKKKTVIAAGTKTWKELAKKGIWVTASADALGFESLLPALAMPLLGIKPDDILILTH
ncbi:MAG TPA: hypothetical protein PLZ10_11600, partial [Chitinophagaceae bacterium]|nr:hypothetical protein [Chitinophagaceae bacterium]